MTYNVFYFRPGIALILKNCISAIAHVNTTILTNILKTHRMINFSSVFRR